MLVVFPLLELRVFFWWTPRLLMLFLSPVKSSVLLETVVHYELCNYILVVSVFKYTSACTVICVLRSTSKYFVTS